MVGIRDYSPTAASNLSVGGISIAEGWARASVNNAYRAGMSDIANLLLDQGGGTATTGSGNAFLLDLPTAPTAYDNNLMFICRLNHAITGPATININGLGVKPLKKLVEGVASPLEDEDAFAGDRPICIYSSADNAVLMLSMGGSGSFTHTGGETWPVKDRMKEQVYLLDFIPQSEHAAIRAGTSTYDCSDAMDDAMACITVPSDNPAFYEGGAEIIFPYGTCYFTRTIELKKTLTLQGHGIGGRNGWQSRLLFAPNITGITVNSLTTYDGDMVPPQFPIVTSHPDHTKGGDASTIRGLKLSSQSLGIRNPALNETGEGVGNGIGHGIWCRSRATIEHCIIQYFPQHGLYVRAAASVADTPDGRAVYGNANNMYVTHTMCLSNGGCGMYIDGPDTNAGLFTGMDFGSNKLSAIHESSLIGNVHIMPHTDNNGTDALCSYAVTPGVTQMSRYYCRNVQYANGQALPWQPSTAYSPGDLVVSKGNLYLCDTGGTSTSNVLGGPGLKLQNLADGTVVWDFKYDSAYPARPHPRIPPIGHADSELCWGFLAVSGPVGHIDTHTSYPLWPYLLDGVTLKDYRYGYTFWYDQVSAPNVLIGPYIEGHQPASLVSSPTIVIAPLQYDDRSTNTKLQGGSSTAIIGPAIEVAGKVDATNPRDIVTYISRAGGESLTMQADGDPSTPVALASTFGYVWDETTGTWMMQHARNASRIAQRFTTTLNNMTGGRADAIGAGNTIFQQGIWLGRHPTLIHHLTMSEAIPTAGQWAAGDLVLNAQPLQGEPWGWRCILTGDFAATPPVFQPMRDVGSQQNIADVAFTLTPGTSPHHTRHTGTMTADRAVTLSTTGALVGLSYRISRTSGGAFNLNVGTGPLKALAAGQWCEVVYDGSTYYLSAFGSL